MLTNATQILPLLVNNSAPFLVLTRRESPLDIPILTPSAKNNYNYSRSLTPTHRTEVVSPVKRRYVDYLTSAFDWSAFLCRTRFCDTLVVIFLCRHHHHHHHQTSLTIS
jgi:hypothetical protein